MPNYEYAKHFKLSYEWCNQGCVAKDTMKNKSGGEEKNKIKVMLVLVVRSGVNWACSK